MRKYSAVSIYHSFCTANSYSVCVSVQANVCLCCPYICPMTPLSRGGIASTFCSYLERAIGPNPCCTILIKGTFFEQLMFIEKLIHSGFFVKFKCERHAPQTNRYFTPDWYVVHM